MLHTISSPLFLSRTVTHFKGHQNIVFALLFPKRYSDQTSTFVPWIKAVTDFTAFIHGTYKMCCLIEISAGIFNLISNLLIVCKWFGIRSFLFKNYMYRYFMFHNLQFQAHMFFKPLDKFFCYFPKHCKIDYCQSTLWSSRTWTCIMHFFRW